MTCLTQGFHVCFYSTQHLEQVTACFSFVGPHCVFSLSFQVFVSRLCWLSIGLFLSLFFYVNCLHYLCSVFSFTLTAMFRVIQVAIFNLHPCHELQTHIRPHHILETELRNKNLHYQASQMAQWKRIHLPMQETQETWVWSLGREDPRVGKIPGSGRSPREGNGNPLQYSCLKNPLDRGAWRTTVHGLTKSWMWMSSPPLSFFPKLQQVFIEY